MDISLLRKPFGHYLVERFNKNVQLFLLINFRVAFLLNTKKWNEDFINW